MNDRFTHCFKVHDYDLAATLSCGQAFRWHADAEGWQGVVANTWVHLEHKPDGIVARTCEPQTDWQWLADYLQSHIDIESVLAAFPADPNLQAAVRGHHGLRLLRQPAWECLASFILSSTKQIVQIRQIIESLCEQYGEPVAAPGPAGFRAFPSARRLAAATDTELRACKMGFRAPYLREAASAVAEGQLNLDQLGRLPYAAARSRLTQLSGVGEKIADCVLLFAYGHADAFPIDVWIARALRQFYFRGRHVPLPRLRTFASERWRGCGGYAQQYLFQYIRHQHGKTAGAVRSSH